MRKSYKNLRVYLSLMLFGVCLIAWQPSSASLSGTYTINGSGSATSTNYKTFEAAVSDLVNGKRTDGGTANGPGVGGAVTINVASGTYTEQITIGAISGTSSSSMVIFDGGAGNKATRKLTYTGTSSNFSTLTYDGCEYVQFRNLTIEAAGTSYGWAVNFLTSSNNSLKYCSALVTGGATSSSTNFMGVILNGSGTNYGTTAAAINNEVDSNYIDGGFYGIYSNNSGSSGNTNYYRGDTVMNSYNAGIHCNNSQTAKILYNIVSPRTSNNNNDGIVMFNANSGGTGNYSEISYNKVINAGARALYMATSQGTSTGGTVYGQIYNNIFGGGFRSSTVYGVYTTSGNWQYLFNTIYIDNAATGASAAFYQAITGSRNDMRNNHFVIANALSTGIPFFTYSAASQVARDYNNYFTAIPGGTLLSIGGSTYKASTYKAVGGFDSNSYAVSPSFVSPKDLTPQNGCILGTNISWITDDYNHTTRNNPPAVGALQPGAGRSNDIGIQEITSPAPPLSKGLQSISVKLKNYGNNTLTKATINYTVNGGTVVSETWTGSLAPCASASFTFTTQYNVTKVTNFFKLYTSSPNGNKDVDSTNDTVSTIISLSLSGGYIINNTGSGTADFLSFTDAATALNTGSVSGPVTFIVVASTYTEQIRIGQVVGASATNRVIFQSQKGLRSSVILDFTASAATGNYTLKLDGADYLTFKNMTIQSHSPNYGTVVELGAASTNDSIYNDSLVGYATSSSSTNHSLIFSPNGGSLATNNNSNTFAGNAFVNGAFGIYMAGYSPNTNAIKSTIITGNTFADQFYMSIYLQYNDAPVITENIITTASTYTNYYGMYLYYVSNGAQILKNRISGAAGGYGINFMYGTGTSSAPALVANNFIQIGDPSNTLAAYGMYFMNNTYHQVYHNSINVTSGASASASNSFALYYTYNSSSSFQNMDIENNVLVNSGNGSSAGRALYTGNASNITSDYNDLWAGTGGELAYDGGSGSAYTSISSWNSATSLDSNSVSLNPKFFSSTDLHAKGAGINNKATPLSTVSDDIDGQTRSTTNPDLGADEFTPIVSLDAGVSSIDTPVANFCVGKNPVSVTVTNQGSITLTSFTVNWSVNGSTQTSVKWTGSLSSGLSTRISLGGYTFSKGTYDIKSWTSLPNGGTDSDLSNDSSFKSNLNDGISGTFTIDDTKATGGTNYQTFQDAVDDLMKHGVCGPVVYNVSDAFFYEQIMIGRIYGASAINTILFQSASGKAANVVLSGASSNSSTTNYVMNLSSASWVTFKNMTFERTGNLTYGNVITVQKGASNNAFLNNIITGSTVNSTTTLAALVLSVSDVDSNNNFTGNTMKYGAYGFYLNGGGTGSLEKRTVIANNDIDSVYYQAISLTYQSAPHIIGNTINHLRYTGTAYGIFLGAEVNDNSLVLKNKINIPNGYGIFFQSNAIHTMITDTSLIANNFITVGGTSTSYGIYSYGQYANTYQNMYHNSVLMTNTNVASTAMYLYSNNYMFNVYNNVLVNKGGGYAIYFNGTRSVTDMNFNDLYVTGKNIGYFSGAATNLSDWQTKSAYDANSVSADPGYASNIDLHASSTSINNLGIVLLTVPEDIDGDPRSKSAPDLGADEFSSLTDDEAAVAILSPVNGSCGDSFAVLSMVIKNLGSNSQGAISVGIKVNGGTPITATSTKKLGTGMTDTIRFTTTINTYAGGTFNLVAWSALSGDQDKTNDTFKVSVTINATPVPPTASGVSVCGAGPVTLVAKSVTGATTMWYDASNKFISKGDTLKTTVTGTTNFYASSLSSSGCESKKVLVAVTAGGKAPVASFSLKNGCQGASLSFIDGSSNGTSYMYKFGDGGSSTTANPKYTYTKSGSFTVTQIVSNGGCSDSTKKAILINPAPVAKISLDNICKDTLQFRDSSTLSSGTITTWAWTFGDGNISSTQNPTHYYAKLGSMNVGLTVTSDSNCSAIASKGVNVDRVPTAMFSHSGTGLSYNFTAFDTVGTFTYAWDFGDTTTGSGKSPIHAYTFQGLKTVKLGVLNSNGCSANTQDTFTVRLTAINTSSAPAPFGLNVFPNPFSDNSIISYSLPSNERVSIVVYDAMGRMVANLQSAEQSAGQYQTRFEAPAAGTYLVKITVGNTVMTKQISSVK